MSTTSYTTEAIQHAVAQGAITEAYRLIRAGDSGVKSAAGNRSDELFTG